MTAVSRRRRVLFRALARAMLALALLAAARVARPALGPRYGGELRIVLAELPTTTDPGVPRATAERLLAALMHETAVGIDEEGRPRPALVQSWATAADGREWTLRLAPATFHDGSPVTAEDAGRALRRFLRSGSIAAGHLARDLEGGDEFRRAATESLPGLALADESRLVLRFRSLPALPLAALASPAAAIVSARGAGAGPFVPTTPPSARGLSATAFGRHVRGRPFVDVVRLAGAKVERVREAAGDVTAAGPPLPPAAGLLLLVLDPAAPPFDDARARAVAASSVDREQLARHFLAGGEPTDLLLAPVLLPPWPIRPPSPGGSAAPLRGRVTLRVASDVPPSASQRVVAHLGALGLDVQAIPVQAALAATAAGQPRLLVWYPEVPEAGLALEELAALAGSPAAVRESLDAADAERDADRRRARLQRAEEALRATQVLVPLARLPLALGPRPGVHGLRATASGALIVEEAWVEP